MQSVRRDFIRILNRIAAEKNLPVEFSANATLDEIRLVSELIDKEYLDGFHSENEVGIPCNAAVRGITIAGREYVDKLEDEELRKSPKGKVIAFLKYAGALLLGVIGTLATQWLAKKLGID